MRKILVPFFFLLISAAANGQHYASKIDSLKAEIKARPSTDTNRIKALYNLSYNIMYDTPDEAMRYADEALEAAIKIKWNRGEALGYRQKSAVYYVLSDNASSLDCAQKALKAGAIMQDKLFDATVYSNIANIYADFGKYDKALENYQKLLDNAAAAKNQNFTLIALTNIGSIYIDLQDFKKGVVFFERALKISTEEGDTSIMVSVLNNLGKVNEHLEDYPKAINFYQQAITLSGVTGNANIKAIASNNMAVAHYKSGNFQDAATLSRQSLTLAKEIGNVSCESEAWKTLSDVYEKQNQDKLALNAYKNYILLRDSTVGDKKKQEINQKEMQFEFEKKEAVLTATHQASVKQQQTVRNAIISGAAILLTGSFISFVFYKRRRDALLQQKEAMFKTEVADTEMKALRAQMNPHFIFNSLNSISDYIAKNDSRGADSYLGKFAKLMRMILENAEQKEVPLAADLKALELYMQLEALRMNNKFSYEIMVDENLDKESTMIPPLILQPFVENSIWHGIANKEGSGKIIISIKKLGSDMISCVVEDDGIGRQQSTIRAIMPGMVKNSFGMKITQARIDILNKLKNTKAAVELSDLTPGVRVEVRLPFATNF